MARTVGLALLVLAASGRAGLAAAGPDPLVGQLFDLLSLAPEAARPLVLQAATAYGAADYPRAEELGRQALAITEQALGQDSLAYAVGLTLLAGVYIDDSRYERAEAMLLDGVARLERLGPEAGRRLAEAYSMLSVLTDETGRDIEALDYAERCWELAQRLPEDDWLVDTALFNLAGSYFEVGLLESAVPTMKRVLELRRKHRPESADVADCLQALGHLETDLAQCEAYQREAQAVRRRLEPPPALETAIGDARLGQILMERGRLDEAEPLAESGLRAAAEILGPDHPELKGGYELLASLDVQRGRWDEAVAHARTACVIEQAQLARLSEAMVEADAIEAAWSVGGHRFAAGLALCRPGDGQARALAFESASGRKGLVLAAQLEQRRSQRAAASPEVAADRERLRTIQSQLAASVYGGRSFDAGRHATLAAEADALRLRLAQGAAAATTLGRLVPCAEIAARLPARAAMIEYFWVQPGLPTGAPEPPELTADRYLAFVVRPGDTRPALVDLGSDRAIDEAVADYRRVVSTRRLGAALRGAADRLAALVWRPLEPHLRGAERVFIAADGDLHLVPFAALPSADGRYLVEDHEFGYLLTARDLLQPPSSAPLRELALFAAPEFDGPTAGPAAAPTAAAIADGEVRRGLATRLSALPGAADEARQVAALAAEHGLTVESRLGAAASESGLKALAAPSVLHLATHGFYLPADEFSPADDQPVVRSARLEGARDRLERASRPAASLRSVLALAGAAAALGEAPPAAGEDGLLTAEEVSTLDLDGTRLVVASACESGLGDVVSGEGVVGLRRAFAVAGADEVVLTLWQIADDTTVELITDFYRDYLIAGQAPAALAAAQRRFLAAHRGGALVQPYYWAAFIAGR